MEDDAHVLQNQLGHRARRWNFLMGVQLGSGGELGGIRMSQHYMAVNRSVSVLIEQISHLRVVNIHGILDA